MVLRVDVFTGETKQFLSVRILTSLFFKNAHWKTNIDFSNIEFVEGKADVSSPNDIQNLSYKYGDE